MNGEIFLKCASVDYTQEAILKVEKQLSQWFEQLQGDDIDFKQQRLWLGKSGPIFALKTSLGLI